MDLTAKEVAKLLQVPENIVIKWAKDGKIPAYKLKDQYRFDCNEVEDWILGYKDEEIQKELKSFSIKDIKLKNIIGNKIGTNAFCLFRSIYKGGVLLDVDGETKEAVIRKSMSIIAKNLNLDAFVITDLLLDREKMMPTSISRGVGVPHTRDFMLDKPFDVISVVYLKNELEYGALDKTKVHTLFFLFASDPKKHLQLLSKIALFAKEDENLEFLKTKPDLKILLKYIKNWEMNFQKETVSN